jgi:hypothetical protein
MSAEIKNQLIEILFSKMNLSYATTLGILGLDIDDEKQKRERENKEGFDKIFTPRATSYTSTGNDKGGKPSGNTLNPDNTQQQDDYNKTGR